MSVFKVGKSREQLFKKIAIIQGIVVVLGLAAIFGLTFGVIELSKESQIDTANGQMTAKGNPELSVKSGTFAVDGWNGIDLDNDEAREKLFSRLHPTLSIDLANLVGVGFVDSVELGGDGSVYANRISGTRIFSHGNTDYVFIGLMSSGSAVNAPIKEPLGVLLTRNSNGSAGVELGILRSEQEIADSVWKLPASTATVLRSKERKLGKCQA